MVGGDIHSFSCLLSILDRVTRGSTLAVDVQRTETPPKGVIKREQELMEKFKVRCLDSVT